MIEVCAAVQVKPCKACMEWKAPACLREGWHIDHIVPKSLFDCSVPDELRAAWSLLNLRLLPAAENRRKGASRMYLI